MNLFLGFYPRVMGSNKRNRLHDADAPPAKCTPSATKLNPQTKLVVVTTTKKEPTIAIGKATVTAKAEVQKTARAKATRLRRAAAKTQTDVIGTKLNNTAGRNREDGDEDEERWQVKVELARQRRGATKSDNAGAKGAAWCSPPTGIGSASIGIRSAPLKSTLGTEKVEATCPRLIPNHIAANTAQSLPSSSPKLPLSSSPSKELDYSVETQYVIYVNSIRKVIIDTPKTSRSAFTFSDVEETIERLVISPVSIIGDRPFEYVSRTVMSKFRSPVLPGSTPSWRVLVIAKEARYRRRLTVRSPRPSVNHGVFTSVLKFALLFKRG